jgi:hypothetical protein
MKTKSTPSEVLTDLRKRFSESPDQSSVRLTIREASAYIPMTTAQLAQLRFTGKGPKFLKPTPRTVLYRKGDIDAWLDASVRTSTVEAA